MAGKADPNVAEANFKAKVDDAVKKVKGLTAFLFGPEDLIAIDIGTYAAFVIHPDKKGQ